MTDTQNCKRERIPLAGAWAFRLDPDAMGIREAWFSKDFDDSVQLPGTTDGNAKGERVDEQCEDRLSRVWRWIGPAWYRRKVTIPESWRGKHIVLRLERTKNTQVWVDRTRIGGEDSLSAPHVFDASDALTPGDHWLSILVDNSKLPPVGPCHAVDERTQTNWNGILGRIELEASAPVWIDDVQAHAELDRKKILLRMRIANRTAWRGHCEVVVRATSPDAPAVHFETLTSVERSSAAVTDCALRIPIPGGMPLWDEFTPARVRITVRLKCTPVADCVEDEVTVVTGLRSFKTERSQFVVNGKPVFLRGRHDACIFPLTGHPPMDREGWLRVFRISRSYGLNHHRFHSWCPPEAAFEAADELGIYLQPELPNKEAILQPKSQPYVLPANAFETRDEVGAKPAANEEDTTGYLRREGEKILRAYGNHPSFVMITLGNEIGGDRPVMKALCDHFRAKDGRHLYAQGSNHFHWEPALQEGDEFWVTGATAHDLPTRGSSFQGGFPGHVENRPPSTTVDFSRSIAGVPVPVVGHETGQYQVSPDFREIGKYTGVLRARNLEIFRERLKAAGMLDQADDFVRASGALSVICYREDIEAALRTPWFGGFQLLDLQDFPGQGTALIGILNAFLESKGLVTPGQWREFCSETVPLLWMTKYTWTSAETFAGRIRVAHYGAADIEGAQIEWTVKDPAGRTFFSGATAAADLRRGEVNECGLFSFALAGIPAPCRLELALSLPGTPHWNRYPIWVYPETVKNGPPPGVKICRALDAGAKAALAAGGRVLLLPETARLSNAIKGSFQCDFWCWPMFRRTALRAGIEVAPGTLGILCDPDHPALRGFPTEFHSNWQWWHLVKSSRPVILDETPAGYRPLVQVIDNFARNHKLGILFEAQVGKGRLLVCSIDLPGLQEKPEARQLMASLLGYMESDAFAPRHELDAALLGRLLATDGVL